jgi:hypothetical protein
MGPVYFATQSYQSPSLPLSAQRCVNCYMEAEPPDAKTQMPLFGSPGLTLFATCGAGPIRGGHQMAGVAYFVSAHDLWTVSAGGVATKQPGVQISGSAAVQMSDNGTQLCMVDGNGTGNGYIFTTAGGLVQITDPGYSPASTVTYHDQYFVFAKQTSNQFFASNLNDGTVYNALAFGIADVAPGYVQAVVENHEMLLVFTQQAIETWYDAGTSPFAFQRYDGGTIERGTLSPASVVKEDNTVFWLGDDLIFYRMTVEPMRISTHAIEAAWRTYQTTVDAFAFSYTIDGHKCIVLTFPSAPATWIYDISAKRWHERESWDGMGVSLGRWRANAALHVYEKILVGDAFSGQIGLLDPTAYTEYGNILRLLAVSAPIHKDRKRVSHPCLEIDIEAGIGDGTAGQGSNPLIMLDWSDDGGRSYKQLQRKRAMGKQGEYRKRVRFNKLGQARQRVYRMQITDPVKRVVLGAYMDGEVRSDVPAPPQG